MKTPEEKFRKLLKKLKVPESLVVKKGIEIFPRNIIICEIRQLLADQQKKIKETFDEF